MNCFQLQTQILETVNYVSMSEEEVQLFDLPTLNVYDSIVQVPDRHLTDIHVPIK